MTTNLNPEQHIALLRHLAGGKSLDVVAAIMRLTRQEVLDVASKHGYPDPNKLAWAADVLAEKQEEDEKAAIPQASPQAIAAAAQPRVVTSPKPSPPDVSLTKPDEIRVLLNTAKAHPSKRIQAAANKAFDSLDRLRALIAEDQEKKAEKRKREAEKAAAKAEVERLARELAAAKAKLRGTPAPKPAGAASSDGPSAKDVRAWAAANGVECPGRGRIPEAVRTAYDDAHQAGAA